MWRFFLIIFKLSLNFCLNWHTGLGYTLSLTHAAGRHWSCFIFCSVTLIVPRTQLSIQQVLTICLNGWMNACLVFLSTITTGSLRWKGVRNVICFLISLLWPSVTQGCYTAKCGKEFTPLSPSPNTSCPETALDVVGKRMSIIRSDKKVIPTLEKACDIFSSTGSKTPLSVNWSTDNVCVWNNITETGLSLCVVTYGRMYMFDLFLTIIFFKKIGLFIWSIFFLFLKILFIYL